MMIKIYLVCGLLSLALLSWADVPVEDISQNSSGDQVAQADTNGSAGAVDNNGATTTDVPSGDTAPAPAPVVTRNLSKDQRLNLLESQMQNLVQMNIPQQISEMRQQLQEVKGQLEITHHQIEAMSAKEESYYKDLDLRIDKLEKTLSQNSGKLNAVNTGDTTSPLTKTTLNETNSYQQAFQFLGKKQFDQARAGFQNYLQHYPQGKFAANAHYWLGEIYMFKKNNLLAEKEFSQVVQKFPTASRISDAKLKLALIHINENKTTQARQELLQIKKQYPDSTAAQLASIQMQQLDISKTQ